MLVGIFKFYEHFQSGLWGAPFSDLPALIAHYTERVSLLYHNLSNCFDCTLHWKWHYIDAFTLVVNLAEQ